MGKSPVKWMKNMLHGKKSAKSYSSKKAADGEEEKIPYTVSPCETSQMLPDWAQAMTSEKAVVGHGRNGKLTLDAVDSVPGNHDADVIGISHPDELTRLEEAATMVQAALRGDMARQEFHALKAVIRLQALVRGRLVRRQAAATLHCTWGIVNVQALVRGRRVRCSDIGAQIHKKGCSGGHLEVDVGHATKSLRSNTNNKLGRLPANVFISKIFSLQLPTVPLLLQYKPVEPNSASKWLERWTVSHFWGPVAIQKEMKASNTLRKQSTQTVATGSGLLKQTVWQPNAASLENNSSRFTSDYRRPKQNFRTSNIEVDSLQDHPQNELERVKRNLRKISLVSKEASDESEVASEMHKQRVKMVSCSHGSDVKQQFLASLSSDKNDLISAELKPEADEQVLFDSLRDKNAQRVAHSKRPDVEVEQVPMPVDVSDERPHDDLHREQSPAETVNVFESVSLINDHTRSKNEQSVKENHELRRRSRLVRQEYQEEVVLNTRKLPSYMATTESAKAKLRGLESPRPASDGEEETFGRRHSLPASVNRKLTTVSPHMQRLTPGNGKYVAKTDRPLSSSRDGYGKAHRPDWRR